MTPRVWGDVEKTGDRQSGSSSYVSSSVGRQEQQEPVEDQEARVLVPGRRRHAADDAVLGALGGLRGRGSLPLSRELWLDLFEAVLSVFAGGNQCLPGSCG